MKVIGTGLACLDIINDEKNVSVMNGGTCANVLTVLAQLGESATMLLPEYINDLQNNDFYLTLKKLNVDLIFYGKTKQNIPRIVEAYDDSNEHFFYTKCPYCNENLIKNKLITEREAKAVERLVTECDVFFTDRISSGIKEIAKEFNEKGAKVFYEPNSGRNLKALMDMAKLCNILKVSTDRISMNTVNRILSQCQNNMLEVVITTHGKQGLSFCYKMSNGEFSNWIEGPYIEFNNIVDTSGAGDWLTAGFLHYWDEKKFTLSKEIIYNTLKKALRLSEIACMAQGAQGAFYNKTILQILKREYQVNLENPLKQSIGDIRDKEHCDFCLSEKI